jgi:two-component system nitrate/nitrite response regulator NarL
VGVVVADAHPLFLDALERTVRAWPEFELLGVAADASVLDLLEQLAPHVLLIDPTTLALTPTDVIAAMGGDTRVLVITSSPEPAVVYSALEAGVSGFLAKDASPREVCDAIAIVARGESFLGASVQPGLASEIRLRGSGSSEFLTQREREVLALIAGGLSAPEIARRLKIGTATVKTHQHHIYERLGVRERAGAVAAAMRRGLIE